MYGSMICSPTVIVGFKNVNGSWKIIESWLPCSFLICLGVRSSRFSLLKRTSPPLILPFFFGFNPITVWIVTVFPQPDSPTIAIVSFLFKCQETPRTAWTLPWKVWKDTFKSFTSKIFSFSMIPLILPKYKNTAALLVSLFLWRMHYLFTHEALDQVHL